MFEGNSKNGEDMFPKNPGRRRKEHLADHLENKKCFYAGSMEQTRWASHLFHYSVLFGLIQNGGVPA